MKTKASQNARHGSDFRAGEGILPEAEVLVLKRGVSLQLQQILEQEHVTNTELALRIKNSQAVPDWMPDPSPWPAS